MRLAVKDARSGVIERVLKMKFLPRELCFAAAQDWLAHADPGVRAATIERLGSYATREVVPLLLPLLEDRESGVRSVAVQVLGSLAAVEAESALLALRADPSSNVRGAVTRALGTIRTVKSLGDAETESSAEETPEEE
jgi:HEAT repeat protein